MKKIDNHDFDLIIYGDIHHSSVENNGIYVKDKLGIENQLFWSKVSKSYSKNQIIFIDGKSIHEDRHMPTLKSASNLGTLFIKEIDDQILFSEQG